MKRYQECNFLEKIWRTRWYLVLPFIFLYEYTKYSYKTKTFDKYGANLIWSINVSILQLDKMNYYWESEEVFSRIKTVIEKK